PTEASGAAPPGRRRRLVAAAGAHARVRRAGHVRRRIHVPLADAVPAVRSGAGVVPASGGAVLRVADRLLGAGAAMSVTRVLAISGFALAFLLVAVVEVLARREGSRIPTLAEVVGFVMRYEVGQLPVGRIAVLGFWWWVGWHFFARC